MGDYSPGVVLRLSYTQVEVLRLKRGGYYCSRDRDGGLRAVCPDS